MVVDAAVRGLTFPRGSSFFFAPTSTVAVLPT